MKPSIAIFSSVVGSLSLASADLPPQPQVSLMQGEANTWDLSWQSIPVRTYFMQMSQDLVAWDYVPEIEFGDGGFLAWGFESNNPIQFFRLKYTDTPTTDPDLADFDGDGVASIFELKLLGTDPLVFATDGVTSDGQGDSDGDGIADALELHWYGNLTTMTATSDVDGDGILDIFEAQAGSDPQSDDAASSGARTNFVYDAMGRLTDVSGSEIRSYSFDSENNYESIQE